MKFFAFFTFALIAAASADVSHLRQYLPPVQDAGIAAPSNQYIPPVAAPAPGPAPIPQAASFNQQDGYNYQTPF